MNFDLTEERQMLQDSLRRFLRDKYDTATRNGILESEAGFSADIWNGLAELGVIGALFTEEQGGFGGAGFDVTTVFEELGRAGVVEPLLDSAVLAGGLIAEGSRFRSVGYSMDVGKRGVLQDADRLGFRLSSPLRVTSGGLNFDLPVSYDYATESADFALRRVSLAPDGHEMMGELAWSGHALDGILAASVFYRSEPGHVANAPDDRGVLLRWSRGF